MSNLPTVIASSVIRSAHQGESHGGVYLVDLESGLFDQVIDWNDCNISWEGRGADRGLRGIAFYRDSIYLAASDEIFIYDSSFAQLGSITNKYLRHCHEIFIADDRLLITSTGFDSVLEYDLAAGEFVRGYCVRMDTRNGRLLFGVFDPVSANGPAYGDTVHINSVHLEGGKICLAALNLPVLLFIQGDKLGQAAPLVQGTHNARPFRDGVLYNDTANERVVYSKQSTGEKKSVPVVRFDESKLEMTHLPKDHARQAFARGLCVTDSGIILGGSSPSTISAYDLDASRVIKSVNLTLDIRNSIHGLEIWPFQ